jgi:hypothetical protein
MCAVHNTAVFCSSLISCFPSILLSYLWVILRWIQLPHFYWCFIIIIIISSSSSRSSTCLKLIEYEDAGSYHTALLFHFLPFPNAGKFPQTYIVPMQYRRSSWLLKHDVMKTPSIFQPNAHDILNTYFIKSLLHVSVRYTPPSGRTSYYLLKTICLLQRCCVMLHWLCHRT